MIYQISQVSNRDTQLLYFYRILRHSSNQLSELYRYDNPDVFFLDKSEEVVIDDQVMYEYHLAATQVMNRIPYLEFMNEDEEELKHIEDLTEVEVKANELIIRGNTNKLTENTSVFVYWVPSLQYIAKLQEQIESTISSLEERYENDKNLIDNINVSSGYVMNVKGLVPNLANIGEDDTGLIYDDSRYRLSGSLSEQLLVNPPQSLISSILKSHTGDLQIRDNLGESKVYQGFYGGRIKLSGKFKTLVLKDITSIVLLSGMSADKIIIENCPAVMFRTDIKAEGKSRTIKRLEVRNSYLTVYQSIVIKSIWCYRRSTVVLKKGKITAIGFIEAGSTFVYDTPSSKNSIDIMDAHSLQGLFSTIQPPKDKPYLDDIFLSQKPITFQRSQIEDPVPISEAIVHIYLNQRGTPPGGGEGGGTGGGKIYSPFTDWYWSGDSRTVGLRNVTGTAGEGFGGMGLSTLEENESKIIKEAENYNLIFWWGVNGLEDGYPEVYTRIANSLGDKATVFVGTVGRVMNTGGGTLGTEGGWGDVTVDDFNEKIKNWNEKLKSELSGVSNIHVLDIWQFIEDLLDEKTELELAAGAGNGLHYSADLYQRIYDWVCSQITNVEGIEVDTKYTPFDEYVTKDLSDSYLGELPNLQNIDNNVGLGIMYGISLNEYGDTPVGWLYARMFRTYLMLGMYKKNFSKNLTEEGRALLNPDTGIWSFGTLYNESSLLGTARNSGSQEGLSNFYYMLKYGGVMTGYTKDTVDIDKMRIIAGGAPTGNNSETGCPQDGKFHENYYAANIVDAIWIYDSPCDLVTSGTRRMTYYSATSTRNPSSINPNI